MPSSLNETFNSEMINVSNWLIANKLTINVKKTSFVIFKSIQKKLSTTHLNIKIVNEYIDQKQSIKFLGVFVDENLIGKSTFTLFLVKFRDRLE